MGNEALVEAAILEGKKFLEALDQAGCNIMAAFWACTGTEPTWKLFISSANRELDPAHGRKGPYAKIIQILSTLSGISFIGGRIQVISPDHEMIKAMSEISVSSKQNPVSFFNCVIGDMFFEGLYIYRINEIPS